MSGLVYSSPLLGEVEFPVVTMDEIRRQNAAAALEALEERRREAFGNYYATYGGARFSNLSAPTSVVNEASAFCSEVRDGNPDGRGLLLFGSNGVGKTYLAAAIANEAVEAGKKATLTSMRDLIALMPYGADLKIINRLLTYDLVVLDDLGAERNTPTGVETAFTVVDKLYSKKVGLVITSNLSKQQIANPDMGSRRLMDRLKERCRLVEYSGPNKRQGRLQ